MTKQISALRLCPWCESEMQIVSQVFDNNLSLSNAMMLPYSIGRTVHEEWHCVNPQCDCRMILDGKGNGTKINWSKRDD